MQKAQDIRKPRSAAMVDGASRILQLVRAGQAQTTSALAAAVGMARSTVNQRLGYLADAGLIVTETVPSGGRGRPAAVSAFNPRGAYVLAAHLGLTGGRLAATDLDGAVLAEGYFDIDLATGPDRLLADLSDHFDRLVADARLSGIRLAGVGVGVPRSVELLGYLHALNLSGADWDRDHFSRALRERYRAPVHLDTDVNLLALAERRRSWPDAEVLVCVKLGTLIDAAVVVNGVPVRGARHLAGELGHVKVGGPSEPCYCGGVGCLDAVASGSALVRRMSSEGTGITHVSQVVRYANGGMPEAVRALRDAGRHIGEALSYVVNLLNPDVIAVWGYLAEAETLLFSGIREGLYKGALPGSSEALVLTGATLGDVAGVSGAATLVIDEVLEPSTVDQMIIADGETRP